MKNLRILLVGHGAMGHAVESELNGLGHEVVARVTSAGDAYGRGLRESAKHACPDVAIEFTHPDAAAANVTALLELGIPVVSGTTGWDAAVLADMALVTETSFLYAANFSIGVAVMKRLATIAAEMFRPFPDFQAALVERHHHRKQDAPSGTAKMLGNVVQAAGGVDRLPIVSLRQGGIAGEHSLIFEGQAESLALTHTAHSRQIFAIGAVRAADWLHRERPIGLVSFDNFLERTQTWTVEV